MDEYVAIDNFSSPFLLPLKVVPISDTRRRRIYLSHYYVFLFPKHNVFREYKKKKKKYVSLARANERFRRARDRRWKMTGLILIAVVLALVDTYDHWLRMRFVMTSLCVQILNPPPRRVLGDSRRAIIKRHNTLFRSYF